MSFDTRNKIITVEEAREIARHSRQQPSAFVTHMEVLGSNVVRRVEQLAARTDGKFYVILTDPPSPLASLEARAEIAAALRAVDYVISAPEGAAAALDAIQPGLIFHDEEEDCERTRLLMEHVRSRSRS